MDSPFINFTQTLRMKEQLLSAWDTNRKMNQLLIQGITDAGMNATLSTRGGRTVYQQWAHLHQVRLQWLDVCAKGAAQNITPLDKAATADRKKLLRALDESGEAIGALLERSWEDGGKVKGFKKGVIPFLAYFIAHEAHHRGNILLTLKQSGEKIPDSVKWGLWEWGK